MHIQLFILFLLYTKVGAKASFRHSQANKQFISQLEEGQFEVVHPFQIRDKNERIGIDTRNYFLNSSVHYRHVTIVIRSNTLVGRLKLILNLNDYLFFNDTIFKTLDITGESSRSGQLENCFYQGTVNGDPSTFVALSTCSGLHGIIAFNNGTAFGLWPLDGGDRGRRHPHVIYRTKWFRDSSCGSLTQIPASTETRTLRKRETNGRVKYIESVLIGDFSFIKQFNLSENESIFYILETMNIADLMVFRELNVHLSIVYGEICICTSRAVGIIKAVDAHAIHEVAQFAAHAVAHILGIDHDSPDCICDQQLPCIMTKQIGNVGSPFAWQFSKCSSARMQGILQTGHVQCLLNKPFQSSGLHRCGNNIVDEDEQCDCGPRNECFDPCCDPLTCTLRPHAQCASHQKCCIRCELKKAGAVCRESRSVCDVPEMCDGESGDCPSDGFLVDGIACGVNGHCWKGNCSDIVQQCRQIWGANANAAEEPCYELNEKGTEYSSCGKERNGEYKKCETVNRKCGTLHCRGGTATPIETSLTSFNLQFLHSGKQIQCKAVSSLDIGMAADGTMCDADKVCVSGACLPLSQVSPPVHCPSNNLALQCSGHGDCTTTQKCLCYDSYSGVACDIRSPNASRKFYASTPINDFSVPSLTGSKTLETTTLLGILLLVGILLLLLLVCLLFFYRRRTSNHFSQPELEKSEESYHENENRAIKFGQMPSYREEKRKRKKNKRVYDALQRITEAVEERDSISLKSRESATPSNANMTSTHLGLSESMMLHERRLQRDGSASTNSSSGQPHYSNNELNDRFRAETIYAESYAALSHQPMIGMNSPTRSDFCVIRRNPRRHEHNGYATDSEAYNFALSNPRCVTRPPNCEQLSDLPHLPRSTSSSRAGSSGRLAPTPLKLSNIQMLLRHLEDNDDANTQMSEPELGRLDFDHERRFDSLRRHEMPYDLQITRGTIIGPPEPPPASADSGHPGSNYDIRQSPSIFSDPFKIDLDNSPC
uniref:Uncharacterized protein n=1 Tax=Acrobeloides nanus TaxID=290746 RepID=A0A914C2R1_9BILA